uniref:Uncharacterized protein n=1 Tax=Crocodylus porosus TaxID=8502 RepID=A0A7M4ERD1_CROPO
MLGFQRAFRLLRATTRNQIVPRGTYKPLKTLLTLWFLPLCQDQAIGLIVMFSVFLSPSGWVLAHIQDYRAHQNE